MSPRTQLHDCFAAAGRPITRGDLLVWEPTDTVVRVTSVAGLCTVRYVEGVDHGCDISVRVVTRRLLKLSPQAELSDAVVVQGWRLLTQADGQTAIAWLRQRSLVAATAPLPPKALAAALYHCERRSVVGLLPHTLIRLRPSDSASAPWLREAGHAAWAALFGELMASEYEYPEPLLYMPERSCRVIERWVYRRLLVGKSTVPVSTPQLGWVDAVRLNAVHQRARCGRQWASSECILLAELLLDRLTYLHRESICADAGVHRSEDIHLPDVGSLVVVRDEHAMHIRLHGLPAAVVVRHASGWGWALRLADGAVGYVRQARCTQDVIDALVRNWMFAWRRTGAWLPTSSTPAGELHCAQLFAISSTFGAAFDAAELTLRSAIQRRWIEHVHVRSE